VTIAVRVELNRLPGWFRVGNARFLQALWNKRKGATCAISRAPSRMPHDSVFIPEPAELTEDPFGLFPSECQKAPAESEKIPPESQKVPSESQKIPSVIQTFSSENKSIPIRPARVAYGAGRQFVALAIASLVRVFAVLITVLRRVVRFAAALCVLAASAICRLRLPRWRLPAWHLPTLRCPTLRVPALRLPALRLSMLRVPHVSREIWHLRAWHLPKWRPSGLRLPAWRLPAWRLAAWRTHVASVASNARPFARQIAARTPISGVTLAVFGCGVIVGGSAVWLSGASNAHVESTISQQPVLTSPQAAASSIPPAGTAFANAVAVTHVESQTSATTASASARRLFRGSLVVNSRPSGARVFLNGRNVGQTPLVLRNQTAGSRAVRVALDGYEPWSSAVQVVADTETQLRAELKMQRATAQP